MAGRFAEIVDVMAATGHKTFDGLDDQERTYALQKLLVGVIVARHLNSVRAAEFIRDRTLTFSRHFRHHAEKTERYQPARRKEVLMTLWNSVTGSVVTDWSPEELRRIFGLSTREEVDAHIGMAREARELVDALITILSGIRDAKRATSPEVLQLVGKKANVKA